MALSGERGGEGQSRKKRNRKGGEEENEPRDCCKEEMQMRRSVFAGCFAAGMHVICIVCVCVCASVYLQ